jgi:hypothetical protein
LLLRLLRKEARGKTAQQSPALEPMNEMSMLGHAGGIHKCRPVLPHLHTLALLGELSLLEKSRDQMS